MAALQQLLSPTAAHALLPSDAQTPGRAMGLSIVPTPADVAWNTDGARARACLTNDALLHLWAAPGAACVTAPGILTLSPDVAGCALRTASASAAVVDLRGPAVPPDAGLELWTSGDTDGADLALWLCRAAVGELCAPESVAECRRVPPDALVPLPMPHVLATGTRQAKLWGQNRMRSSRFTAQRPRERARERQGRPLIIFT
jgi:hypothetical protein